MSWIFFEVNIFQVLYIATKLLLSHSLKFQMFVIPESIFSHDIRQLKSF